MRGKTYDETLVETNKDKVIHAHVIPQDGLQKFTKAVYNDSVFRQIGTTHYGTNGDLMMYAYDNDTSALWGRLPELFDEIDSPVKKPIFSYRLSLMTHLPEEEVYNEQFNFETTIMTAMGKGFAKAENNTFINGTGVDELLVFCMKQLVQKSV